MATLNLKNVYKYYENNSTPAVSDFNLDVKHNEFVVFVGPSGCGKSTTLRMIAGLEEISKGEVLIDNVVVNDKEPKDRDIAMVFQNYALYPHMTVYNNMAFGLKLATPILPKVDKNGEKILDENDQPIMVKRHYTKKEINEKIMEAANVLEITEYLKRKPRALSGGQRQRVAIGRAFVRKPKLFLMDEPLSNLDAKLRNQMRSEIISLHNKIDTTFIYVTHDQIEAMTLGDRIVVMKDGFIQQVGTPKEVFDNPVNLFVAGFIGTPAMNFIEAIYDDGTLHFEDGRSFKLNEEQIMKHNLFYKDECAKEENNETAYYMDLDDEVEAFMLGRHKDKEVEAFKARNEDLKKQKKMWIDELRSICSGDPHKIVFGIRPEHFSLDQSKSDFECQIEFAEMMGSEYHIHAVMNGQKLIIRSQIMDLSKEVISSIEQRGKLSFSFNNQLIHIFDKKSERTIF